jgi:hypothetical protein
MEATALAITALVFSVISLIISVIVAVVGHMQRRADNDIVRSRMERSAAEIQTRTATPVQGGASAAPHASEQPATPRKVSARKAEATPPQTIAPNLSKPPKPKGGFGSKTEKANETQVRSESGGGEANKGGSTS